MKKNSINELTLIIASFLISLNLAFMMVISNIRNGSVLFNILSFVFLFLNILYSLKNVRHRLIFLFFNLTFFVFLLGGLAISILDRENVDLLSQFSDQTKNHIYVSIYLTLSTSFISYFVIKSVDQYKKGKKVLRNYGEKKNSQIVIIRKISFYIAIVTFLAKLITVLDMMRYLRTTSYYDYYTTYNSNVPAIIQLVASIYYISTFIYLGSMPSKKESKYIVFGYLLISVIILISGERGEPISNIAAFFIYVVARNLRKIYDFKINKKKVLLVFLMLPFVIYGLQILHYERNNIAVEFTLADGIEEFFVSQGGSIKVLGYGYDYKDSIKSVNDSTYTIGTLKSYISQNIVTRSVFRNEQIKQNTIKMAYSGYSLNQVLSYLRFPTTYVQGRGMGSSYIAELYHDFGYVGIVIGNILLMMLIVELESMYKKDWIRTSIYISIVRYILLIPRGACFTWFVSTFSIQNIGIIIFIIFVARLVISKKNYEGVKSDERNQSYIPGNT